MKISLVISLAMLTAVMAVLTGCSYSTAGLTNVKLCSDPDSEGNCTSDTSTFNTGDKEILDRKSVV